MVELEDKSCKSTAALKAWIVGELKVIEEKFKAIEAADKLLREQNKIHFENLNNEGRRITSITERTVSQDTWQGFTKQYEERHTTLQRLVEGSVSKDEFFVYKTATERALTLKAGQSQGISMVGAAVLIFFSIVSSLAAAIGAVIALRH
jgi:hypothetical protein